MYCSDCRYFRDDGICTNPNSRKREVGYFQKPCDKLIEKLPDKPILSTIKPKTKKIEHNKPQIEQTMVKIEQTPKTKTCARCGRELPIEQFRGNLKAADGHISICNECYAERRRKDKEWAKEAEEKVSKLIEKVHEKDPKPNASMVRPNGKPLIEAPTTDPTMLKIRRQLREGVAPSIPKDEDIAKMVHYASSKLLIAELTNRGWKGQLTYVMTANLNCE